MEFVLGTSNFTFKNDLLVTDPVTCELINGLGTHAGYAGMYEMEWKFLLHMLELDFQRGILHILTFCYKILFIF